MNSKRLAKSSIFIIAVLILPTNLTIAQKKPKPTADAKHSSVEQPRVDRSKTPADPDIAQAIRDVSAQRIRQTIEKLVSFGTRHTLSVNNPGAVSSDKGIVAARNWIRSEFERYSAECGGCLEVKTDTFVEQPKNRIPQATEIQNVYAILRGTDPEQAKRMYLVTGHYDSRNTEILNSTDPAPGANDDGSGTAVSLECARVLSKHKFPATIIFLTVAGEEQGLNGSAHFAKLAKSEGWQLEGVLNNDIVGGNRTPGDTLQNGNIVRVYSEGVPAAATDADLRRIRSVGGEDDSIFRELARYVREVAATYEFGQFAPKLMFRRDRYLRGGDHISFNEQGFAAVRLTEYREDFNHQHQTVRTENGIEYADLPKFVDFEYVANVARLNAATLASLAAAPPPPAEVRLLTTQLENESQLEWKPSIGAIGYEVLWRDTTDAYFPGENLTRTTDPKAEMQQSKDNVVFAVRSVDAKGHRSVIVVPEPERQRNPPAAR